MLLDFGADSEKIRNEIIRMLSAPGGRRRAEGVVQFGSGESRLHRSARELRDRERELLRQALAAAEEEKEQLLADVRRRLGLNED